MDIKKAITSWIFKSIVIAILSIALFTCGYLTKAKTWEHVVVGSLDNFRTVLGIQSMQLTKIENRLVELERKK